MPAHHRLKGIPIKVALVQRGLSQAELADKLGMPASTLNMKILGERKFSEIEMSNIAQELRKPASILFREYSGNENTNCEQNTQEDTAINE
jgi:transcriptional regulator with XRE-family HTH domain